MKNFRIKILTIILVSLLNYGFAQQPETFALDSAMIIAAKNNPDVKVAFNQYLASLEKVPQVGTLPDPQASFSFFIKPMAILGGNQVANIQVMQMFPWFGTLQLAKDEASEMAKAKYEVFNVAKADLFYQVKSVWYQLMKLDREIELVKENIELLKSLEKLALVKFQSPQIGVSSTDMNAGSSQINSSSGGNMNVTGGGMSGMNTTQNQGNNKSMSSNQNSVMQEGMASNGSGLKDVLRVRMEILEQQSKLSLLTDQRKTAETGFNVLLNRDVDIPVNITDSLQEVSLPFEKTAIADSILTNNPMLSMLEKETSSYEKMEEKARKMGLPMVGIGLNYMINQKREDNTFMMNGKDMVMPMVSVSIPVYRKKYNAMQKEARLMQEAAKEQTKSVQNNLQLQYRNFIQNLDDAGRRIKLYSEQEELAQKTTDLLLTEFASSGAGYEEVLRMQYKVIDYGFKRIEAITDLNTTVAMAEKLMNSVKID